MNYEWDDNKASSNWRKHGILFSDAVGVFEDEMALSREDIDAFEEQRFVVTGMDFMGRILTDSFMLTNVNNSTLFNSCILKREGESTKDPRKYFENRL